MFMALHDIKAVARKPGSFLLYKWQGELRKANVKVFQMHSKSKSLLLRITEQPEQVLSG